jgi:aryl-alcohol dehydrogenase-like predicted oxidoreductase
MTDGSLRLSTVSNQPGRGRDEMGAMTLIDRLAGAPRIGLGLAAVGRPAYINLGRDHDLPPGRSVDAMHTRVDALLDEAYRAGVRYFDVARSYGRAEEFLAGWLATHPVGPDVVVGSKWGYTYVAGWRLDAGVHEVKDHSLATFERQAGESRALLGDRLDIYHIHSLTPQSPALTDTALHHRLADLAAEGVAIGFSTSGPAQAATIRAALRISVGGMPLFRSVQATWNVFETSAGPALAEAHDAGCLVIVKEAMANGRLAAAGGPGPDGGPLAGLAAVLGSTPDAVALAAVLRQPWARIVLSGAATTGQLTSNLTAESLPLTVAHDRFLSTLVEEPEAYWRTRSSLAWA